MNKNKKVEKAERRDRRWYGMKKIKQGQKVCWLAKEDKNGWSLGLAFEQRTLWLRHLRLKNRSEVERVKEAAIVFIHKKHSKEPIE